MSTLKFCPECNNILYPKEDKEVRLLKHACRHCDYQEVSDNNIVFRMELRKPSTEGNTGILKDAVADASLPRTRSAKCANCNHSEAVFFQLWSHLTRDDFISPAVLHPAAHDVSRRIVLRFVSTRISRLQRRERKALRCSLFAATRIAVTVGGTKDSNVIRFVDAKSTYLCPAGVNF